MDKTGVGIATGGGKPELITSVATDFDSMTHTQRRELLKRLRLRPPTINKVVKPAASPPADDELAQNLDALLQKIGINAEPWELNALASGARVNFGRGHAFRYENGRLIFVRD